MKIFSFLFIAVATITLSQCAAPESSSPTTYPDPHSFANFEDIKVTHISLDLEADFDAKIFKGSVNLTLKQLNPVDHITLDSRALNITSITGNCNQIWIPLSFKLAEEDQILGSELRVELGMNHHCNQLRIDYQTSPEASGLQWLSKEITANKKFPFMFSQSETLHGRSWIPMQDTPAIRVTYDAHIQAPKPLRVLMSANNDPNAAIDGDFDFVMEQAISPYLIAIAIGDIRYHRWSERTGVWAEKATLEAAAYEFEDTEKMIVATESSFGQYPFGQYDLLVLPPSFPFGGMENPRLSFITPTVIVGDKSLTSMISHELAHSWSGNLVTNARWADLWLNEGVTTYLENRILEKVYGKDIAEMEAVLSYQSLVSELKDLPKPDQRLYRGNTIEDPDDAFTAIPYQKGGLFFFYLEKHYGREHLDSFLKSYFKQYQFKTITSEKFIHYLTANLIDKYPETKVTESHIQQWIYEPGLPESTIIPTSFLLDKVDLLLQSWKTEPVKFSAENWSTQEWVYFLSNLPRTLSQQAITQLDQDHVLSKTSNPEISLAWFPLVILNDYQPGFSELEKYLLKIGRIRLIYPLYELLEANPKLRPWASKVYIKARHGYHPLTKSYINELLKLP